MHRSSSKGVRRTAGEVREALAPALGADRLRLGVPLAPYTTFRIGGPADVLYDATSADELATAVTSAHAAGIPCFVLGLGANILVGDRGVRGLVVRNLARGIQDLAGGRVRPVLALSAPVRLLEHLDKPMADYPCGRALVDGTPRASGLELAMHGGLGLEWQASSRLGLVAEVGYERYLGVDTCLQDASVVTPVLGLIGRL